MKKRWLGILLALCLLVCFAPAALATETEPSLGLAEVYVSAKGDDETGMTVWTLCKTWPGVAITLL